MDAAFCLMSVAYAGIGLYLYETRSKDYFILLHFLVVVACTGAYIFGRLMGSINYNIISLTKR